MGILFDLLILHLVAYSKDIIRPVAIDLGLWMLSIIGYNWKKNGNKLMINWGKWLNKFSSVMDWSIFQRAQIILGMNSYWNKNVSKYIFHPKSKTHTYQPHAPDAPITGNHQYAFCLYTDLPIFLDISSKWNHTTYDLWGLAPFTQHNAFENHSCCC